MHAGVFSGAAGTFRAAVQASLWLVFEQTQKDDLYLTALTLETLNDRRAVPPLIRALLEDGNPHRRHAAARALGWIHPSDRTTALALAQRLVDSTQPLPAREEAAESLASVGGAPQEIQLRHIENCRRADPAYGQGVAEALGIAARETVKA